VKIFYTAYEQNLCEKILDNTECSGVTWYVWLDWWLIHSHENRASCWCVHTSCLTKMLCWQDVCGKTTEYVIPTDNKKNCTAYTQRNKNIWQCLESKWNHMLCDMLRSVLTCPVRILCMLCNYTVKPYVVYYYFICCIVN